MRPQLALMLLLAACGDRGGEPNGSATANQLERLSRPRVVKQDGQASARLEPLQPTDPVGNPPGSGHCAFTYEGQMLLVASRRDALARLGGELRYFVPSAPFGPTGGFFEDRQISISVGRAERSEAVAGAGAAASITVTNRRTRAQTRLPGLWTCDPVMGAS